jgi:hypothetical protein
MAEQAEISDVRKAMLQLELVKGAVKLFGPQIAEVIAEAKPVVDALSSLWVDTMGTAYRRLREEYGCSDETARALVTLSLGEASKSVTAALKK